MGALAPIFMAQDNYKTKMVITDTGESLFSLPTSLTEINGQKVVIKGAEQALDLAINLFEAENDGMKLFSHSVHSINLVRQMHTLIFKREEN